MKSYCSSLRYLLLVSLISVISIQGKAGKGDQEEGSSDPDKERASSLLTPSPSPLPAFRFNSADTTRPFTTFKTTRLLNAHSVETLLAGDLDFRITHRFGDMAGDNGGIHTLFGIDEARDIRFGFEYGITNDLSIGIGRSKGSGPLKELYDGYVKYRFLKQTKKIPFTITALLSANGTIMRKSEDPTSPTHFEKFAHRLSYFHQLMIASRISDRLSLQLMPSYSHRNLVGYEDHNSVFGIGLGGVLKVSKKLGIIGEYHYLLRKDRKVGKAGSDTYDPYALGFELETGGHVFHVTVSNSGGIGGGQYLPHTVSDAFDGEFRLGFTISRLFQL